MIKRITAIIVILLFALVLLRAVSAWRRPVKLGEVAGSYAGGEVEALGAQNLVTAVVVIYRGLDTLGEVTVLFLAAAGVALLLGGGKIKTNADEISRAGGGRRPASEILTTGADYLLPVIIFFGVYIFLNGHLTPGGGFQGGAVIASAVLLIFLAHPGYRLRHTVLGAVESGSGFFYLIVGLLGLLLAGGFLDGTILPLGRFGSIASAGAMPVIYTLIGLKVGTELSSILERMGGRS